MKRTIALPGLVLLSACTVGPDYKGPPASLSGVAARGAFVRAADPSIRATPGLARWWDSLNDATLTALIDDALAHSPTIDAATASIRAARAGLAVQRAAGLPSVSATASYLHAELPGTGIAGGSGGGSSETSGSDGMSALDYYNLGGIASWEPDLFGAGRRGVEQARAMLAGRFADLADAQVSLTAQVAQAYVNLRGTQQQMRLTAQSTALQRRALALMRQRYAAGTASALDVERLQSQLDGTEARNRPLAAQADGYLDQIAVLTGRAPGALDATLSTAAPVPLPPATVPVGDPATLIAQRPDIRSAERALAASSAQIGIDKAKLFPSIRFLGVLGLGGPAPGDVVDIGSLTTLLAPSLNLGLLDFGRKKAAVRKSEAERDRAEAQYRTAVLTALDDAETSLSRFGNTRLQLAQLLRAEESATRAARLNGQRVQAGTSTLIDQLDIERQQLQAAIAVAQASAQLTSNYIAVQKSLGLGWATPAAR